MSVEFNIYSNFTNNFRQLTDQFMITLISIIIIIIYFNKTSSVKKTKLLCIASIFIVNINK